MNLHAYDENQLELFCRNCKNKYEAKRAILNGWKSALVEYVIYKNKRYSIKEIYQWK